MTPNSEHQAKPKDLFFPNKAISIGNRRFFTGRQDLLAEATRRVGDDGFSAVVYGDRGVGKTSFGWQLLQRLTQKGCKCIWFKCQDYMFNLETVLNSVLVESLDDYSFKSHFPELYEDSQVKDTIQRKYGFNFAIVSAELTVKKGDSKSSGTGNIKELYPLIQDLFKDTLKACQALYPETDIVIFFDEVDSLPDRSGIGQMIKGVDNAKFVIIGIADQINEIITDHPSAERKLANSTFKVPRLDYSEVLSLFDRAEEESQGQVIFDSKFRDEVNAKSDGYPYLIQQFGYFAMQTAQDTNPSDRPLVVSVDYLAQAIDKLFNVKAENIIFTSLFNVLNGDGQARREILRLVALADKPPTNEEMKREVLPRLKQHIESNIKLLIDAGILRAIKNGYRFANPEARILAQLYFKENSSI